MAKFLILGGAGYIGSHMVNDLLQREQEVVVFDNLSTGNEEAIFTKDFVPLDITDKELLLHAFRVYGPFDCVMHFCARSLIGESIQDPGQYYLNNVTGTLNLLQVMRETGHDKLIFSSSAAIFGHPRHSKINEQHPQNPINPYGQSKLMVENMLRDFATAYQFRSVSLRYFNAAGADPSGKIGEKHEPETHLIPNILQSIQGDLSKQLKVFGNDYDTPDGSCIRDYIHVNDLADAHYRAFQFINENNGAFQFNLGNGKGFSVFDVIRTVEEITGKKVFYEQAERRPGDPAMLVADSRLAQERLGWRPHFGSLKEIIETAWWSMLPLGH